MEDAFNKLQQEGKNNVDSLIHWMKETTPKIVDGVNVTEEAARKLFEGVDSNKVELAKFKEVLAKLADEQKKSIEDMHKNLAETGPRIMNALMAGVEAFKEALANK